ncbi:MAG: 50S ribosomal protein L28 [Tissierellia bacterium]|nr:50S ribosomal protein L28 [Tissierellia bacterium]
MSKKCEICGKEKTFGNTVSFSHKRGNRSWSPNLQRVRAVVNGSKKRIYVCTRCLRSGRVERAI